MNDEPLLDLLRLLAEGASAEELSSVHAPDKAVALAVRAAGRVAGHRSRERSWRALVDTAGQLAAAEDDERILDAIVDRARALLDSDLAYLTLVDPDQGDTYVRAISGGISSSFQALRVPHGVGLGGRVAKTRQPCWTTDYGVDDRFLRDDAITAGVSEEAVVAVCGTPLVVEGELVGVLFGAHRSQHNFAPDEIALLGSLASLAAITIRQAGARAKTEHALQELSEAHARERARASEIEQSAEAHDRFVQLVATGGGVDGITELLADVLGGWNMLFDVDGTCLSMRGTVPEETRVAGDLDPVFSPSLLDAVGSTPRAIRHRRFVAVAVRSRSEVLAILVCGAAPVTPTVERTIERAAAVTTLLLMFERETAAARAQAMSDHVATLLGGVMASHDAALLFRREGLDPQGPFCLLAVQGSAPGRLASAVRSALGFRGLVGQQQHVVIAIVPGDDPGGLASDLVHRLRRADSTLGTAAGVGPFFATEALRQGCSEATRTLDAMIALGRHGQGAAAGDLGFAGLVTGDTPDVRHYVRRTLGPLLDYDRERGTDLVATLEAYFAAGRSPRHASERLHVHVNTVVQRLDRVGLLLGENWSTPENSLEVQLALHLRRMLGSPPS